MNAVGLSLLSKAHTTQGALPGARGLAWVGDVTILPRDTQTLDSLQI